MVDYGYQLNDDEKLYIKHKELNQQINSFEDNFISNTIDTALFSSGLYFVKITDGNKSSTKKILKL